MSNTYPRETVEFQPVTVTVDGTAVTADIQLCVTAACGERPAAWVTPTTLDGRIGVMVDHPAPGSYRVWAQVSSSPETPVVDCGVYQVS